ncbi:MAG: GNAT family N-acetyltransferase [Candidatus Nanohaloarchaea archaeon]
MNLRRASIEDAEEIVLELWLPLAREMEDISDYNELADELNKEELIDYRKNKLKEDNSVTVVSESEEALTGFATISTKERSEIFSRGKYAKVNEIYVKKDFRKQGIASELLDKLFERAKELGCEQIELNVNVENEAAKELYKNKGFDSEKIKMVKDL